MANPVTVVAMLALGLLIGAVNGVLITRLRMNNFVVTLSMLIIVRGFAFLLTQGKTVTERIKYSRMAGLGL